MTVAAPQVLMVGAGAVGQVFALHLSRAGAQVSFLVKPEHPLEQTLRLFPARGAPTSLPGRALRHLDEVRSQRWDQVWLAVPSHVLGGKWLQDLLGATGNATVVALAPESEEHLSSERLVLGAIPFMAWQRPLPGESGEPGVAYWVPPLARVPVSGSDARVRPVLDLLVRGGLKGQRVPDAAKTGAPVTAILVPVVAALELAGWSLRAFRGRFTSLAAHASREALRLSAPGSLARWAAQGWLLGLLVRTLAWVAPFDLERYLRFHFTKVGEQTRVLLSHWTDQARGKGLSSPALAELVGALPPSTIRPEKG